MASAFLRKFKPKGDEKYQNNKIEHDGYWFASKLEAAVYGILKERLICGEIKVIQCQDHIMLVCGIKIIPDFKCTRPDGLEYWVEAKGFKTPDWIIKKKLWAKFGPGDLYIYEGRHTNPIMTEIVNPCGEGWKKK